MFEIANTTIKLIRGDTAVLNVNLATDDGSAYSLSSDDAGMFSLKRSYRDEDYVLQIPVVNDQVTFAHNDTKDLPDGDYVYDIQITLADGQVFTIARGKFMLLADVTKE